VRCVALKLLRHSLRSGLEPYVMDYGPRAPAASAARAAAAAGATAAAAAATAPYGGGVLSGGRSAGGEPAAPPPAAVASAVLRWGVPLRRCELSPSWRRPDADSVAWAVQLLGEVRPRAARRARVTWQW
jgi:hypothetical protein